MLSGLPFYIPLLFMLTTLVTFLFFIAAVKKNNTNKTVTIISSIIIIWLTLHAILGFNHFYTVTNSVPPRFALMVVPAFLFVISLFIIPAGRRFIDSLSPKILTQLHVVRVFVEIILFLLCTYKFIPVLMTFEGRNFDILSGLSAPFVAWYGFTRRKLSRRILLLWNIICLVLLLNIVINAVFSAPFPFQQLAFDQPNVAVLYFPFVWLPCFIVPAVLLSHLVLIRRYVMQRKDTR